MGVVNNIASAWHGVVRSTVKHDDRLITPTFPALPAGLCLLTRLRGKGRFAKVISISATLQCCMFPSESDHLNPPFFFSLAPPGILFVHTLLLQAFVRLVTHPAQLFCGLVLIHTVEKCGHPEASHAHKQHTACRALSRRFAAGAPAMPKAPTTSLKKQIPGPLENHRSIASISNVEAPCLPTMDHIQDQLYRQATKPRRRWS